MVSALYIIVYIIRICFPLVPAAECKMMYVQSLILETLFSHQSVFSALTNNLIFKRRDYEHDL